ncbi:MAG: tRNA (adenine(22)-N(1))-methyltransferase TrmK, partial [Anaerotignum sp.]|nr:tRNA (adenine(22)-N(1))-methyltransferase TrmK [Anaerotignum sp.]
RKYLHEIGFSIAEEHMLKEDGKPYVLMRCEKGAEKYDREIDYLYGKLLLVKKDPVLKELLLHEEGKYSRLFDTLKDNPTENAQKRIPEVEEKLALMREALACL